jgi:hypothetical protein
MENRIGTVKDKDYGKGDTSSRLDLAKAYPGTPEKDELVKKSAFGSDKSFKNELANTDKKSDNVSFPGLTFRD